MATVFISHAGAESEACRNVKAALNAEGFVSVFLDIDDERGIQPGEQWERELYRQIERADAVVLLLSPAWIASKWCFAELSLARMLGKAIFPAQIKPVENAPVVRDLQHVKMYEDFDGGLARILSQLRRVALDARGGFELPRNRPPFPGLMSFEADDAAVYFGRQPEIASLWQAVRQAAAHDDQRFIALSGASGAGKSSLLRAGFLPRLRFEPDRWRPLPPVRPGSDPFRYLAAALAGALGGDAPTLAKKLRASPDLACRTIVECLTASFGHGDTTAILSLDQAEELFSQTGRIEREHFLALIAALATDPDGPVIIAAIRSDHLARLRETPGLGRMRTVWTPELPPERIPDVIRSPARTAGLSIEEALVLRASSDAARPGALPLLAFALRELYDRHAGNGSLRLEHYLALSSDGDGPPIAAVLKSVAARAVNLDALSAADLAILRALFVPALVEVDAAGNFARRTAELRELSSDALIFVEKLSASRLIRSFQQDGREVIEISHEALFQHWDLLAGWLAEDRAFLEVKADVEREVDALDDPALVRQEDAYLTGFRLTRARDLLDRRPELLSKRESDFVVRSAIEADKKLKLKRRVQASALSLAIITATVLGFFAWELQKQLILNDHQARKLQSQYLSLLARQEAIKNPYIALEYSTGAAEAAMVPDSLSVLAQIVLSIPRSVERWYDLSTGPLPNGINSSSTAHGIAFGSIDGSVQLITDASGGVGDMGAPRIERPHGEDRLLAVAATKDHRAVWVSLSGLIGEGGKEEIALGEYIDAADIVVGNDDVSIALAREGGEVIEVRRCDAQAGSTRLRDCFGRPPLWTVGIDTELSPSRVIALAPGGESLAVSDSDSNLTIHTFGGSSVRVPAAPRRNGALAWSPDGTMLAVADDRGLITVTASGVVSRLPMGNSMVPRTAHPTWSADGKQLAAACDKEDVGLCLWTRGPPGWEGGRVAVGHARPIRGVFWRGNQPVTIDQGGRLLLWRSDVLEPVEATMTNAAKNGPLRAISPHPSGDGLAVATGDAPLWIRADGTVQRFTTEDRSSLSAISWSGGADWLAATSENGELLFWRPEIARPIYRLRLGRTPSQRLNWSEAERAVVVPGRFGRPAMIFPETKRALEGGRLNGEVLALAASSDGGNIIAVTDLGSVVLLSTDLNGAVKLIYSPGARAGVVGADGVSRDLVDFHPSNAHFVVAGNSDEVSVFDPLDPEPISVLKIKAPQVQSLGFSADGRTLAFVDVTGTLHFWRYFQDRAIGADLLEPLFKIELDPLLHPHARPGDLNSLPRYDRAEAAVPGLFAWHGNETVAVGERGRLLMFTPDPDWFVSRAKELLGR